MALPQQLYSSFVVVVPHALTGCICICTCIYIAGCLCLHMPVPVPVPVPVRQELEWVVTWNHKPNAAAHVMSGAVRSANLDTAKEMVRLSHPEHEGMRGLKGQECA